MIEQDLGESHLKTARINFPPGFTVNSALNNVGVCDEREVKRCDPDDAIGETEAASPVLSGAPDVRDRTLTGRVHLMMQDADAPPTEPLTLGVYLTHRTFDLEFQIYGTMQMKRNGDGEFYIEAEFDDLPQVPISSFDLDIDERLIKNPPSCGQARFSTRFDGHNDRNAITHPFVNVLCDANHQPAPFAPTLGVQTSTNRAGANPNLTFNIDRGRDEQTFDRMEIGLPPGLIGNPEAVPKCSFIQARTNTCPHDRDVDGPSGSKIGEVTTRVQVFGFLDPLEIRGKVYMGDQETMDVPYRDDPGVMFVILDLPEIAGGGTLLLDLRMQLRRLRSRINTTISDLPTEFDVRRISMTLFGSAGNDHHKVLTNPTSCGNDKRFIAGLPVTSTYLMDRSIPGHAPRHRTR